MNRPTSGFEAELRVSLKPVLIVLLVLGVTFVLLSDSLPDPSEQVLVLLFAMLFSVVSTVAWVLDTWKPQASRWFTITALVAMIHLGNTCVGGPEFLALAGIPSVLAAALIGLPAATAAAIGEYSCPFPDRPWVPWPL